MEKVLPCTIPYSVTLYYSLTPHTGMPYLLHLRRQFTCSRIHGGNQRPKLRCRASGIVSTPPPPSPKPHQSNPLCMIATSPYRGQRCTYGILTVSGGELHRGGGASQHKMLSYGLVRHAWDLLFPHTHNDSHGI